jgi:hypothetical protein
MTTSMYGSSWRHYSEHLQSITGSDETRLGFAYTTNSFHDMTNDFLGTTHDIAVELRVEVCELISIASDSLRRGSLHISLFLSTYTRSPLADLAFGQHILLDTSTLDNLSL